MATTQGCIDLLSTLASLDPRMKFDQATALGWTAVLADVADEALIPAGIDAARNAGGFMVTVGLVEKYAQPYMRKIARDVRSARIRGWVPADWPVTRPIPPAARQKLTREFDQTNNRPDEVEGYSEGRGRIDA